MRIAQIYSHLNGLEFMMVHKPEMWQEIQDVIQNVDAEACKTKISKEKTRTGKMLYSPTDLNKAFKKKLEKLDWEESRVGYYVVEDLGVSRELVNIRKKRKQKELIEERGFNPLKTYNQVDFVKDRVAIEVQFGKYFSVQYDLHVKHTFFYGIGDIDVGVEIIPMHSMMSEMSSGVPWYENELMNIVREGRSNPAVPIILIGIEP